jgi:4-hydroxy-tetrahydrodipicolinate reductase
MNILLLGRGKTGSLVAEVARQRGHHIHIAGSTENEKGAALTAEKLREVDVVIDFTTPQCVVGHIEACTKAGKNMVVGTTGWYGEIGRIKVLVETQGTLGVNLFLEVAQSAAAALHHGYSGQIFERHHATKKDAPSGTAIALQRVIHQASGNQNEIEITSFREGEVVGMHEVVLESPADRIYLCHDAKSRQGFADGAVRAAEWIAGKKGFYNFKDVWREL